MIVVNARNNPLYGGAPVNQKYSPLEDIELDDDDHAKLQDIFNARIQGLNSFPSPLKLYAKWAVQIVPRTPPMVVISSNRAEWLAQKFTAEQQGAGPTNGYLDNKSVAKDLILWYTPKRSRRPLFIVVHHSEYAYYTQQLSKFDKVQVVGWKYGDGAADSEIVGFGASRFAALEMVKKLGYHMAWLVDDNVVQINGFPAKLDTVEAEMKAGIWGLGFRAATSFVADKDALKIVANYKYKSPVTHVSGGLLQQVVLWNIDSLNGKSISPYFVTSNEDSSFSAYLSKNSRAVVNGMGILKMTAANDQNNPGSAQVAARRTALLLLFQNLEKQTIQIKTGVGAPVPLDAFIGTVLEKSLVPNEPPEVTQSRAVEQILTLGVGKGWAPDAVFDPYPAAMAAATRTEQLEACSL